MDRFSSGAALKFPDVLLHDAIAAVPVDCDDRTAVGIVFDLRQRLADRLIDGVVAAEKQTADTLLDQDRLREALPPLHVPAGPFRQMFSVPRTLCAVLLGSLLGMATIQALLHLIPPQPVLSAYPDGAGVDGLPFLGAVCGVVLVLWCIQLPVFRQSARQGWRRWLGWGLVILAGGLLLWDVLHDKAFPVTLLGALGDLVVRGNVAAVCFSRYGLILCAGLVFWLTTPALRLDAVEFGQRLSLAARVWWEGACACVAAARQGAAAPALDKRRFQEVGRSLLSFAGELPPERRVWLEEQVRLLGLEAPRQTALLRWGTELSQVYDALGYLEPGDPCFEDTPPLWEHGRLLRKGQVRKVRS